MDQDHHAEYIQSKYIQQQICTFKIAGRLFGVEITDVKEIHPPVKFTPVFHAGKEVKGFVNIRGHIYLIIDLRILLGFESIKISEINQIILFKPHVGKSFGLLVDSIGNVVKTDKIQNSSQKKQSSLTDNPGETSEFVKKICKLEKELLVILNSKFIYKKIISNHNKEEAELKTF